MKDIILIVSIALVAFYLILITVNYILNCDKKHSSCKYCNECDAILDSEYNYCSNCGKELDEELDFKFAVGEKLSSFILPFKKLYKTRDIVYFEDFDSNYIDFSICLKDKEGKCYLKELQNNEKFLNMIVLESHGKRVRDGFMKSHCEFTVVYSSGDKKNMYDDYALECSNGGINND